MLSGTPRMRNALILSLVMLFPLTGATYADDDRDFVRFLCERVDINEQIVDEFVIFEQTGTGTNYRAGRRIVDPFLKPRSGTIAFSLKTYRGFLEKDGSGKPLLPADRIPPLQDYTVSAVRANDFLIVAATSNLAEFTVDLIALSQGDRRNATLRLEKDARIFLDCDAQFFVP